MYFIILAFIAIAGALVWYLLKHDHGRKLPVETLWYACGFGVLAMILAVAAERYLLPHNFLANPSLYPRLHQLGYFMGVGFIEEAAKFLPLALFIYKRNYFREHTDGCIYFAICGLAFGLGENILYTATMGTGVGLARLVMTPFFHAAATSILGYYLINSKLRPDNRWFLGLACVLVPVMHGLYNFGLGAGVPQLQVLSMMLTLLFSLGLFLYFMEANVLDKVALQKRPIGYVGLPAQAVVSAVANFCERCGRQNTDHHAYCEYCGRKL